MKFNKSKKLLNKALKIIPAQAQTFSKNWTQYPLGQAPIFSDKAKGGYIWDVDGNKFIDWPMALGPIILGHNNKKVNLAVTKRLKKGVAFSLPNKVELELSEKLIDWFPYAEAIRFGKNGSDVTSAAVRAARAYTKKDSTDPVLIPFTMYLLFFCLIVLNRYKIIIVIDKTANA